jgi:hypothetical protein
MVNSTKSQCDTDIEYWENGDIAKKESSAGKIENN